MIKLKDVKLLKAEIFIISDTLDNQFSNSEISKKYTAKTESSVVKKQHIFDTFDWPSRHPLQDRLADLLRQRYGQRRRHSVDAPQQLVCRRQHDNRVVLCHPVQCLTGERLRRHAAGVPEQLVEFFLGIGADPPLRGCAILYHRCHGYPRTY